MRETVEAIYENGLLRPLRKIAIPEGKHVHLTLETAEEEPTQIEAALPRLRDDLSGLAGCLKSSDRFKGDPLAIQKKLRDEWA